MEKSRTQKSISNIISGLIYKLIALFFPFLIRIVMIRKLGVEYLGLNSLFTSILMVLSLSELGVGSALVYNMYKPMAENDVDRVCALLNVYKKFYRIIGFAIAIIGLSLLPFLDKLVSGGYPNDINIYVLYLIYLLNTVLSYLMFAYKKSLLEASQQNSFESRMAASTTALMYILQICALLLVANYYAYIIVMPFSTLLLNIIRSRQVDKMFPQYTCRGVLERGFIKGLFSKVRALLGHKIGSTVITACDSIIISSMLGLEILAVYSNYYQIINALIGVITVIYTAITASVGNSLITSDKKSVEKNFYTLNFINNWLVGWCSVCLFCLYQPFMKIWMGEKLMFPMHIVLLFAVYFYAWLSRRIGLTYKDAAGMWEQDFFKPYVGVVLNLGISIGLCKTIGVEGVIIGTIFVMLVVYFPWETWALYKYLFKCNAWRYLAKMLYYVLTTIVAGTITYRVCMYIPDGGIVTLGVKAVICTVLPNIVYFIAYIKTKEFQDGKKRVFSIVTGKFGRFRKGAY